MARARARAAGAAAAAAPLLLALLAALLLHSQPAAADTPTPTSWLVLLGVGVPTPAAAVAASGHALGTRRARTIGREAAKAQQAAAQDAAARVLGAVQDAGFTVTRSKALGYVVPALFITAETSPSDVAKLGALLRRQPSVKGVVRVGASTSAGQQAPIPGSQSTPQPTDGGDRPPGGVDPKLVGIDEYTSEDWTKLLAERLNLPKVNGKGIRVGFVDDGLDYRHFAIGPCTSSQIGTSRCRVVDAYDAIYDEDLKAPLERGCVGVTNGTLVAGVGAGFARFLPDSQSPWHGVAHQAYIGAYRVVPCTGEALPATMDTWDEAKWAGLDRASSDNMDALNLAWDVGGPFWGNTIGGAADYISYTYTTLFSGLGVGGTLMAAAAGDSASQGAFGMTFPGLDSNVVSVASVDNTVVLSSELVFNRAVWRNNATLPARVLANSAATSIPSTGAPVMSAQLVGCGLDTTTTAGLAGAAVLVPGFRNYSSTNPACALSDYQAMLSSIATAKAVAIVLLDTLDVKSTVEVKAVADTVRCFVLLLDWASTGSSLAAAFAATGAAPLRLNRLGARVLTAVPTAKQTSLFSSYGPGPRLDLKPEIAAPGAAMWTPASSTAYVDFQGGASAASFITGTLALLRQQFGISMRTDGARAALMTTALPVARTSKTYGTITEPASRVGAGIVQVFSALINTVTASPYKLDSAVLKSGADGQQVIITLTSTAPRNVTYRLSHRPAASVVLNTFWYSLDLLASTGDAAELRQSATGSVTFTAADGTPISQIYVGPKASATFKANFNIAALKASAEPLLYSGYIQLTPVYVPAGTAPTAVPPPLSLVYQSASQDYNTLSPLAPLKPSLPSSALLKGAPGGLFLACPDPAGASCSGAPAGDLRVDVQGAAPPRVAVAWGKPVASLKLEAYASDGTVAASYTLNAQGWETPYRSPSGQLSYYSAFEPAAWQAGTLQAGLTLGVPYTFKIVVTPAGDDAFEVDPVSLAVRGTVVLFDSTASSGRH